MNALNEECLTPLLHHHANTLEEIHIMFDMQYIVQDTVRDRLTATIQAFKNMEPLNNLHTLSIASWKGPPLTITKTLLEWCVSTSSRSKSLKNLYLSSCNLSEDPSTITTITQLPHLTSLYLLDHTHIQVNDLVRLIRSFATSKPTRTTSHFLTFINFHGKQEEPCSLKKIWI
ncbi:hypothetical protein BDA99DRAFT_565192 [Phascolomyces articulosus]|uniref:Uncharacterized protein n=1 Tax=Phascolomyces articulosus TaxID=60185 RepID=A0AAD5JZ72_9FUNG|nr:hypothetical protein BDA99DRAFT_565192 [Phascolomyces articulosus]